MAFLALALALGGTGSLDWARARFLSGTPGVPGGRVRVGLFLSEISVGPLPGATDGTSVKFANALCRSNPAVEQGGCGRVSFLCV